MLIMLLQVSGGAEGHRREGKHGADAHEPEDQREHAPTHSGGGNGNGNGGATTMAAATATAEQQQWWWRRGSTSVGNQEAGESGECERGGE